MPEAVIRKYRPQDRASVRDIAWDTALMGKPASAFFEDKEVFTDILTLYFTDYEPESCYVVEVEARVVGYLLGAKNVAFMAKSSFSIAWRIILKIIFRLTLLKIKNIQFTFKLIRSSLRGEFKAPESAHEYPATLHINLVHGFRSSGLGSKLMSAYFDYLAALGIKGVHLATMSEAASQFFAKHGFNLLYQGQRSYFRHILGKDVNIYIYGKKFGSN